MRWGTALALALSLLYVGSVRGAVFELEGSGRVILVTRDQPATGPVVVSWNASGIDWTRSHGVLLRLDDGSSLSCRVRGRDCRQGFHHELVILQGAQGFAWRLACAAAALDLSTIPVRFIQEKVQPLVWSLPESPLHEEGNKEERKTKKMTQAPPVVVERSFLGQYWWALLLVGMLLIQVFAPREPAERVVAAQRIE